ncbi:hypothetical protein BCR32DRAFT_11612 [Anaeromyces robustus]|uniref:Periplasmic binding protein-like II n=1 Tax=Anaeromyces robustus TaxID=1754192 RepID=A0A1Y1XN33_9FUNG|nr:hypothetical protein BCR32DRAFT_11612 [Anaeromyces robustus]|eukprot:ORX87141.1 hypothetical protein BCR32DRAFT_11612 [Anaeromyces robustus]
MFSNMNYLNKYNKPIPRTWDELIETAEFILKEEKEKYNNTEIIGYNGLFPDNENTMCSLYQLLYSYRDTVDSPLPDFGSKTAIEAVNKIMEIKDRISSDEIFRSAETLIVAKMIAEELLFVNFYSSFNAPNYTTSVLPGKIDGINGSILGGFNIGINKYIDEKRKIACIEVFKFLLSKDFQRDVIVKKLHLTTPLSELYNDPDACTVLNCEMMNEIQFFLRPSTTMKNYEDFSNKGVKLFYQILDGEKSVEEVLNDFDSYIHVYSFVVNSTVGGIMLGIIIFILVIVILSSVLLFIPKFRSYFNFLTTDVWFIYTVGSIFMLASTVEYYNEPTIVKCKTRQIFNLIGNSLVLIPILYRLVINFPKINSYSQWVHRNNYIFISGFLLIQILLSALTSSVESFTIKDVNFDTNSKNFRMCVLNPTFKPISLLQYIYNIMLYIVICFLIFLEWNIQETYFDLRHFSVVMIMNGITQILFIVLNNLDINNYILYSVLFISFTLLFVITNHIYIFVIRLILLYTSENDDEKKMSNLIQNSRYGVSSTKNAFSKSEVDSVKSSTQSKTSKASKNSESSSSYRSKLLNYHYTTSPVA